MSVEEVLGRARARYERVEAKDLQRLHAEGALVVDIRPAWQREDHGELPFGVVVERNHLEWRLHPSSGAALPEADLDRSVVVVCQEGYASSLAAASLLDIGIARATDVVGGYDAWRAEQADPEHGHV